ncbi:MAG: hypothetical protein AAGM67_00040 [Bacteroidota bacterium]
MRPNARFIPFLLLAIAFAACGEPPIPPKVYEVPDDLQVYIDLFEQEAARRGVDINIDNLRVEYQSNLNNGTAAGLCNFAINGEAPYIRIDTNSNNWQNNEWSREILMFHELGHCILERREHRDDLLPNGNLASLMRSNGEQVYGGRLTAFKREYYLDELFNELADIPEWARGKPSYSDLDPASRNDVFVDNFTNNLQGWPLANTAQSRAQITAGNLFFESKVATSAIFLPKTINFEQMGNFEIETRFRINKGTRSALMQWGGSSADNYYYYGFNRDAEVSLAGNWATGIDLTRQGAGLLPGEYNTFTVRKQDGLYYFFLNEQFFDVFGYESFESNQFAFYIGPETEMQIDYLRISEF